MACLRRTLASNGFLYLLLWHSLTCGISAHRLDAAAAMEVNRGEATEMGISIHEEKRSTMQVNASALTSGNGTGPWYWLSSACAVGLVENTTSQTCYYDAPMLKPPASAYPDLWTNQGSDVKLSFDKNGLFRAEAQHIAELAAAMTDTNLTSYIIADELKLLRHKHHMTRFAIFKDVVKRGKSRLFDFSAIVALKIPTMPHILEVQLGIVQMIASALQSGTIVIGGLGDTALVATLAAINVHAAWVPVVGWTMAVIIGTLHIYETIHHYYEKLEHSEHFTKALVFKSGCVSQKIAIDAPAAEKLYEQGNFFTKPFERSCGEALQSSLVAQIVNTNAAMRLMFEEMGGVGRCLYPEHGHERKWSFIECAQAVYKPTLQTDSRPGILYAAVIMAATYSQLTDAILEKPLYDNAVRDTFSLDLPDSVGPAEELRNLTCTKAEDRISMCVQVLVQHRAFEKTFIRFATAIRGYMKTFGRETHSPTMRTSQFPCHRVIVKPESGEELCKFDDKFHDDEGKRINTSDTCMDFTSLWEHEEYVTGTEDKHVEGASDHEDGTTPQSSTIHSHDNAESSDGFCEPDQLPEPTDDDPAIQAVVALTQPQTARPKESDPPGAASVEKSDARGVHRGAFTILMTCLSAYSTSSH